MTWDVTVSDVPDPLSTEPDDDKIVDIRGMSVGYRTGASDVHQALRAVDFHVGRGETVAVVGESGSGKTTLGMAVGGFLPRGAAEVTASRFRLDGTDAVREPKALPPVRRPGVSMVFQDAMTSLDPVYPIGSQLDAVGRRKGWNRAQVRANSDEWLRRAGLADVDRVRRARPYELSGGMRQRVMLAIALCSRPSLLIADEPTSALDAGLAREMMQLLRSLTHDLGTSVVIISHDLELCTEFSDRTLVMYAGAVVEENASARLITEATHPYTIALTRCIPTLERSTLPRLATVPPIMDDLSTGAESHRSADGVVGPCSALHTVGAHSSHRISCWNPGFPPPAYERAS